MASAAATLGVGIIGAGWWAGEHAQALGETAGVRLIGFSSRSPEKVARFRQTYGGEGYDDYRRLLERRDVEAVAIATPHDTHAGLAVEALQAGKHVLLEKPMARTPAECAAIAAAARSARGVFMLGLTHHFIPPVMRAKAVVDSGELGPIVSGFCASARTWGQKRGRPRFYLERQLGGGVWMTLGVHFVDRLLWLIGTDVLSARGVVRQRFHSSAEQQADDSVAALLTFSSGATGSLLLAGYRSGPIWDEMQIIGERAVLRLEGQNLSVSRGEEWRSLPGEERNPMAIEWDAFASAVRDGTPPPISLDFALKVMETVFAVEESSGAGRP